LVPAQAAVSPFVSSLSLLPGDASDTRLLQDVEDMLLLGDCVFRFLLLVDFDTLEKQPTRLNRLFHQE
jgi:hypothetical protein